MHHDEFNFKKLGDINIKGLLDLIETQDMDWEIYTFRQERYKDHSQTKTIPLIWSEKFRGIDYWPMYEKFRAEIESTSEEISESLGPGVVMSAILINLPKGCFISRHKDINPIISFNYCHRIHVPIITNEKCIFEIEGEEKNLKAGEIWEISNLKKMHSVRNEGDCDRIHLLIDYIPTKEWDVFFGKVD